MKRLQQKSIWRRSDLAYKGQKFEQTKSHYNRKQHIDTFKKSLPTLREINTAIQENNHRNNRTEMNIDEKNRNINQNKTKNNSQKIISDKSKLLIEMVMLRDKIAALGVMKTRIIFESHNTTSRKS